MIRRKKTPKAKKTKHQKMPGPPVGDFMGISGSLTDESPQFPTKIPVFDVRETDDFPCRDWPLRLPAL